MKSWKVDDIKKIINDENKNIKDLMIELNKEMREYCSHDEDANLERELEYLIKRYKMHNQRYKMHNHRRKTNFGI